MNKVEQSSLKSKVFVASLWLFSTKYISQIITWVITMIVARVLEPNDYGLMAIAMIYIGLLDFITELGLGSALIQKQDLTDDEIHSLFWCVLGLGILMCIATHFLAGAIASFFENRNLVLIIRVLSLAFIINAFKIIPFNLLTKELSFKIRTRAELIANIAASFITLVLAIKGYGVWSLVTGYLAQIFLLSIILNATLKMIPKLRFDFQKIIGLIKFGTTLTASRLLWYGYIKMDAFVVGKLIGERALGYYTIAQTIASVPIEKFTTSLLQIMYPTFSIIQKDKGALQNYFLKTTKIIATIMFPILIGILLVADDLIPLMLTAKWNPAIPILKIFCLVGAAHTISTICSPMLLSIGKPQIDLYYNILCIAVMPIAFVIGAQYGILGVGMAWLLVYPVLVSVFLYIVLYHIDIKIWEYVSILRYPILNTLLMSAGVIFSQQILMGVVSPLIRLVVACSTGIVLYSLLFILFDRPLIIEIKDTIQSAMKKNEKTVN